MDCGLIDNGTYPVFRTSQGMTGFKVCESLRDPFFPERSKEERFPGPTSTALVGRILVVREPAFSTPLCIRQPQSLGSTPTRRLGDGYGLVECGVLDPRNLQHHVLCESHHMKWIFRPLLLACLARQAPEAGSMESLSTLTSST